MYNPEMEAQESAKFQAVLADGLRRLEDAGYKASAQLLVGDAVQEIARYARKVDADLIVVGHKHLDSWAARWWRGSISAALIEHAPCSVLCVITP
jgi:nucleotide-binding universal stress UspA family protein